MYLVQTLNVEKNEDSLPMMSVIFKKQALVEGLPTSGTLFYAFVGEMIGRMC